jgi:hypothetical protein
MTIRAALMSNRYSFFLKIQDHMPSIALTSRSHTWHHTIKDIYKSRLDLSAFGEEQGSLKDKRYQALVVVALKGRWNLLLNRRAFGTGTRECRGKLIRKHNAAVPARQWLSADKRCQVLIEMVVQVCKTFIKTRGV